MYVCRSKFPITAHTSSVAIAQYLKDHGIGGIGEITERDGDEDGTIKLKNGWEVNVGPRYALLTLIEERSPIELEQNLTTMAVYPGRKDARDLCHDIFMYVPQDSRTN